MWLPFTDYMNNFLISTCVLTIHTPVEPREGSPRELSHSCAISPTHVRFHRPLCVNRIKPMQSSFICSTSVRSLRPVRSNRPVRPPALLRSFINSFVVEYISINQSIRYLLRAGRGGGGVCCVGQLLYF